MTNGKLIIRTDYGDVRDLPPCVHAFVRQRRRRWRTNGKLDRRTRAAKQYLRYETTLFAQVKAVCGGGADIHNFKVPTLEEAFTG